MHIAGSSDDCQLLIKHPTLLNVIYIIIGVAPLVYIYIYIICNYVYAHYNTLI